MGVLNVTPDSFSDGGCFADTRAAVAHGLEMARGGRRLRRRRRRVDPARRRPGRRRGGVPPGAPGDPASSPRPASRASVDTTRAEVAEAALAAGAVLVNDVSGGLADTDMAELVAEAGVPVGARCTGAGTAARCTPRAQYGDVVTEVCAELTARVEDVVAAGVAPDQLVLDPGLGFAKNAEHNWALLAGLDRLVGLGLPVLVGGLPQDLPRPAARRRRRRAAPGRAAGTPPRWPRPCSPRRPAPGACGCTTPARRWTPSAPSRPCARELRAARHDLTASPSAGFRARPPRRLRLRARARADVPRRRRPRARHRAPRPPATTSTRPSTTPSWPSSCTPSSPASRSTCWRPSRSGSPTSASPTRWSTPSRSPCTSREAELGVPFDDVTVDIRRERP